MYEIRFAEDVADDVAALSARDRTSVLDQIDVQLTNEPGVETRARKPIFGLQPPWEHVQPIWQLRVEDLRVFYDIDEPQKQVIVRAIRHKPPHKTTEEIL